jgi:hypothetical protein
MWLAGFEPAEQEARMNTIAAQITALQTMPAAQLAARYLELFGKAPRVRNAAWLRRQVAWKLQERELGGLSDRARLHLDELVARVDLPLHDAERLRPRPQPRPVRAETNTPMVGTVLTREWHGQQLRVEVLEDGVEWNGVRYGSLSACARAITGSAWNGRLFFGLTQRRTGA